jgi:hypothetical protein
MRRAEPRLGIGDNPRSGWLAAKGGPALGRGPPQGMVARRKTGQAMYKHDHVQAEFSSKMSKYR